MNVIKRNGDLETFDKTKVYKAVMKAAIAADEEDFESYADMIADDIEKLLEESGEESIDIETIQDSIEIDLYTIANNPSVAKEFILFREKRKREREKANKYSRIIKERAVTPEVADAKQNANVDEKSFSGRMYEASEALWKETALEDFMPADLAKLHRDGDLYFHDLSRFSLGQSNCLQCDFTHIFKYGLKTRQSHLRPPSRFASACQQIAVIMQIISQCQYGGVSAPYLDRILAPFVEKSRQRIKEKYPTLSEVVKEQILNDEIKQGAEALIANLSSLQSRSGSPMSSPC